MEAAFDGGRLTSDGGLPWLAKVDGGLGLCEAIAACVPEWRRGQVKHSLLALVRQRVYQIAAGYEDQNDSDYLRTDPLLKLVCGRLPENGAELASQPTMSRLENAVSATACLRMAQALGEIYIEQRGKGGPPAEVLLDFDTPTIPRTASRKGATTTATTSSACITRCWCSTATPASSSRRCYAPAKLTRAVGR